MRRTSSRQITTCVVCGMRASCRARRSRLAGLAKQRSGGWSSGSSSCRCQRSSPSDAAHDTTRRWSTPFRATGKSRVSPPRRSKRDLEPQRRHRPRSVGALSKSASVCPFWRSGLAGARGSLGVAVERRQGCLGVRELRGTRGSPDLWRHRRSVAPLGGGERRAAERLVQLPLTSPRPQPGARALGPNRMWPIAGRVAPCPHRRSAEARG